MFHLRKIGLEFWIVKPSTIINALALKSYADHKQLNDAIAKIIRTNEEKTLC